MQTNATALGTLPPDQNYVQDSVQAISDPLTEFASVGGEPLRTYIN